MSTTVRLTYQDNGAFRLINIVLGIQGVLNFEINRVCFQLDYETGELFSMYPENENALLLAVIPRDFVGDFSLSKEIDGRSIFHKAQLHQGQRKYE